MTVGARVTVGLIVSILVVLGTVRSDAEDASAPPDPAALARRVRQAVQLDYLRRQQFTYLETRRDVSLSRLGKVEVGPLRTFEVHPSDIPGHTYKRLLAVDGRPLGADELARRDREHEADVASLLARRARETARDRADRLREKAEAVREREAIIDDAFAVFAPTVVGRESLDGEAVWTVTLTPRRDARVTTREGRWMKMLEGRAWIAVAGHHLARIELRAQDDVAIGWGILGRVHDGSRILYRQRRLGDAWLPAETIFEGAGRTLLFRKFDLHLVTTYSNHRRLP